MVTSEIPYIYDDTAYKSGDKASVEIVQINHLCSYYEIMQRKL